MAPQMNSQIHPVELDIALHTMFTISLAEPSGDPVHFSARSNRQRGRWCLKKIYYPPWQRYIILPEKRYIILPDKYILSSLTKLFHQIFPPLPSSPLSPALNPLRVKWAYLALSSNFTWFSKFEERQIYPKRAHLLFTSFHLLYTQCVPHIPSPPNPHIYSLREVLRPSEPDFWLEFLLRLAPMPQSPHIHQRTHSR